MIKIINRFTFFICLSLTCLLVNAEEAKLQENPPSKYYVKDGDTLWDISNLFLQNPWAWPEIWHINEQVVNPHLIYPGDEISLVYIDNQPKLMVTNRDPGVNTVKLSPQKRSYQISTTIPTIPLEKVESFLTSARVVDKQTLEQAAYVIAGDERHRVMGKGDRVYAMGDWAEPQSAYGIYRPGKPYIDPETEEVLGYEAKDLGVVRFIREEDGVAIMEIQRADIEIREYDRLLPTETQTAQANFYPKAPNDDIKGQIIRVFSGVRNIGQYDVVVINKGVREGVEIGDVFSIARQGAIVRDKLASNQKIQLPDERAGLLIVFKTHEKVSLGLVLKAKTVLQVGDKIARP